MYVAISGSGKARVIQFREDTRIPGTNKKKTHVLKTLGNYERMVAEDPDIIEKFKAEAKELTKAKKESRAPITLNVSTVDITSPQDVVPSYRFGHALVKQLWISMGLDDFFLERCGKRNAYAVAQALLYLVAHRCADPRSIHASASNQALYAGISPLGLDVFYDVLDVLSEQKEAVCQHLADFFARKTDRQGPEAYYDVTTYAFESTRWGELRMFGFSKDHKNNEVQVVMGLLIDNNGIPISYELFAGNTMDQSTLTQSIEKLKSLYKLDKITVVADRGLNSGSNLAYLIKGGHSFVISYTLKRSAETFKELIFQERDWLEKVDAETGEVIFRSKVLEHTLEAKVPVPITSEEKSTTKKRGRPKKYNTEKIPVHIHLTWSAKRAAKDRADRERMLDRLRKRIDKPYQLKAALRRGCNQFLEMELDTSGWKLDEAKIEEAAKYDGYYAVITNDLVLGTQEVSEIYSGLWKIEESFRIMKTDIRARPVFVWNDEHIKGHFIKFPLPSGEIETLVTNLSDDRMGTNAFKSLYFKRWPVETKYGASKLKFELENFSGRTEIAIRQDFYVTLTLANVASVAMNEAQPIIDIEQEEKENKYDYQANVNQVVGSLKDRLVCALLEPRPEVMAAKVARIMFLVRRNLTPIRQNRSVPRNPTPRKARFRFNQKSNC